jgi:hypothetical protein
VVAAIELIVRDRLEPGETAAVTLPISPRMPIQQQKGVTQ